MKPSLSQLLTEALPPPPMRDAEDFRAALAAREAEREASAASLGDLLRSSLPSPALRPAADFRAEAASRAAAEDALDSHLAALLRDAAAAPAMRPAAEFWAAAARRERSERARSRVERLLRAANAALVSSAAALVVGAFLFASSAPAPVRRGPSPFAPGAPSASLPAAGFAAAEGLGAAAALLSRLRFR